MCIGSLYILSHDIAIRLVIRLVAIVPKRLYATARGQIENAVSPPRQHVNSLYFSPACHTISLTTIASTDEALFGPLSKARSASSSTDDRFFGLLSKEGVFGHPFRWISVPLLIFPADPLSSDDLKGSL